MQKFSHFILCNLFGRWHFSNLNHHDEERGFLKTLELLFLSLVGFVRLNWDLNAFEAKNHPHLSQRGNRELNEAGSNPSPVTANCTVTFDKLYNVC